MREIAVDVVAEAAADTPKASKEDDTVKDALKVLLLVTFSESTSVTPTMISSLVMRPAGRVAMTSIDWGHNKRP